MFIYFAQFLLIKNWRKNGLQLRDSEKRDPWNKY